MQHHSFMLLLTALTPLSFASIIKRDVGPSTSLPGGWTYAGCWSDSVSDRKLHSEGYTDPTGMCEGTCIDYCSSKGYTWAGVEYSTECYCGFGLESGSVMQADSSCDMTCPGGTPSEACGSRDRLSVFTNGQPGGANKPLINGYNYLGCYSDSASSRALTYVMHNDETSKTMTNEFCTNACSAAGYKYAGTEFGGECFCDNSIPGGSTGQVGDPVDSGCDFLCNGDSTEWCGGKGRLTLYSAAKTQPSEQLPCPGFEGCGWSRTSQPTGYGVSFYLQTGQNQAHSGSGYAAAGGTTSGTNSPRTACIAQDLFIANTGTYKLSFYIGGIDNFQQDPRCAPRCAPPTYSLNWSASLSGQSFTGPVSRSKSSTGGASLYQSYSYSVSMQQGYQTLQICALYDGIRRGSEDNFLLDDVSVFGPY